MSSKAMIVVIGGAGFIGSNIVRGLNARGITDVVVVDDLTCGKKFSNLVDCQIADYLDKDDFLRDIGNGAFRERYPLVNAVFHNGASTDTTEWNGKHMMDTNYTYSKHVLDWCQTHAIRFIYASSAAVYGGSKEFAVDAHNERPLNVYGYSKLLFDNYVRRVLSAGKSTAQIVGLRYFNVYGPREAHKQENGMCSFILSCHRQFLSTGTIQLFGQYNGVRGGEFARDYVYVDDVVDVNLFFFDHQNNSGIFNCGTGRAESVNTFVRAIFSWHGRSNDGKATFIDFPDHLRGCFQVYTCADIEPLRSLGYNRPFKSLVDGVKTYLDWLLTSSQLAE